MKTKRSNSCEGVQLEVLLHGDEQTNEFQAVAEHVETCGVCRQRLTDLAGNAQSWSDVQQFLGVSRGETSAAEAPTAGRLGKLDFLGPPSHPEMLGRLGRYEIERVIGTGGMGIVLRGFDTELHRPVAIKVLAPYLAHNGAARQRFAREGRAAAAVVHEHVVAIYNVESDGEVPFLVMQYVAGESLQDRVEREGPLGTKEILRIGIQAAAGLAAAHQQGLVHRDIKPANILLESGVERALLTDFGLARAIDDASLTHTGIVAGTPHYMSPEQASGQSIDHRSDLFGLGAVLYFMATGHPPFRADRPMAVLNRICHDRQRPVREVNPEIPKELARVMDRLLDKRPHRRPAQAADVQATLAEILAALQQGGTARSRSSGRSARRRMLIATAAAGMLVLATLARVYLLGQRPAAEPAAVQAARTTENLANVENRPDALARLISVGPSAQAQFTAEFAHLNGQLGQLESGSAYRGDSLDASSFGWQDELRGIQRQLVNLENLPYTTPGQ